MTNQLEKVIDHTLLKADATEEDIIRLAKEAKAHSFASVCINPTWVKTAADILKDADQVKVCTVIGFPMGATTPEVKAYEAQNAVTNGAEEIDMVINIGALKSGQEKEVEEDIRTVVHAVEGKALTKVIIETCLLTDEEKVKACELVVQSGAEFVKTSTGFSTAGATVEDVALIRKTVGLDICVKASGGVRTLKDAQIMMKAGANRIGASASVEIVREENVDLENE